MKSTLMAGVSLTTSLEWGFPRLRSRQKCIGAKAACLLIACIAGSPISAQAATIPFTFEVTYDAFLNGIPSPATLTIPATNSGSGSFAPFGSAIYSETGTATFVMLPSGDFVPSTVSLNFTASFNGGADTFTGTDFHVFGVSETMTILGGTGIFSGATGFATPTTMAIAPSGNPAPNFFATLATSGSGQITAPGLNAVPEPATMALLSTGLAGLLGVAAIRKRRRSAKVRPSDDGTFGYERKKPMQRQMKNVLSMFSLALGIASAAFGQGGTYTTIDFPGASTTLAWSINKSGDIAGSYTIAGVTHAFKLSGGRFITIDYPGATSTDARGINNSGDISGIYNAGGVSHGFVLSGDKFTVLDFPNATSTQAWGLNSSDDVVGTYSSAGVSHGFKWSGGQFTAIDPPGSTATTVTGINSLGEISGIYNGAGGLTHAFLLSDGEFTSLDVPQATYTNSTALTSHGDVIGRYMAGTVASGYLLREGVYSTIAFPGATFTGSAAMNERGDIVGRYQTADSTSAFHAFLLSGFQTGCVAYVPRVALSSGAAAVTHASDFKLVTAANPAAPGELLSLFATGLGPTRPGVDSGKPFPSGALSVVTSAVEVRVNGTPAEVLGAVGLPGAVDGYQVNFRLPADTLTGPAALQLSAGAAADTSVKVMVK